LGTTDVNGLTIAYQRAGNGPPLILLHGFICDSRAWQPQIDDLSRDFDVIAWDCPGCGRSSDPPEDYSMEQFAGCLAGFLESLEIDSAHLLGLSWGGTLIMDFYRLHPDRVRSAIIADSYAGWTGTVGPEAAAQRLERCLRESRLPGDQWIPQWVPDGFSAAAPQSLLADYAAIMSDFHPAGFRAMSRAVTPDFAHILPTIKVPTLLLWGDDDKRSPASAGKRMHDLIPGSTFNVIPGAGHVSNFEQPARFNAEVRAFLKRVSNS